METEQLYCADTHLQYNLQACLRIPKAQAEMQK